MADIEIIPNAADIAMHKSISHMRRLKQFCSARVRRHFFHTAYRNGSGGISPSIVRHIQAPISGRDAINSSNAS